MDDRTISHYGTPRHSGRYPWGSGEDPEQRGKSFLGYVKDLKKQGLSEVDIAKGMGINTAQLRAKKTAARAEQRKADYNMAYRLREKGMSYVEIGKRMGIADTSVHALLNPVLQERSQITANVADRLRDAVDEKRYIDVGLGVEQDLGVSRTKLKAAIDMLESEGYRIHKFDVDQVGTGKKTNMMVLTPGDVDYREMVTNKDKVAMVREHSEDGGLTFLGIEPVKSISSDRIKIRYDEEGGSEKDGVIEIRRGVEDLSLGRSRYAQVRIAVDGTHYLKGMAMYSDNMPEGVDIIYNTNKKSDKSKSEVFKKMKVRNEETGEVDQENPFGATIKAGGQHHYKDRNGVDHLSAINIVNEEGDWSRWSKTISSQVLSKQPTSVARKQLGLAYDIKKEEFDEIMALTNPAVKKRLLDSFSDDCDSAAVHLKAAALPRQASHAILPFPDMKETEIYAPNYRDGEKVVLIRYPHGGTFEIPQLTVNNKHALANKLIPHAKDAVGINSKVAERLSGADFDGDTVLVIPNNNGEIKTTSPLANLKNFNTRESYPPYHGMRTIDGGTWDSKAGKVIYAGKPIKSTAQKKMGDVSNLITDMTIGGANTDEIARAVRHSMVVIDAEKHHLDYRKSYIDNNIAQLKTIYQGGARRGASTLISRASSDKRVHTRKELRPDPETGKRQYKYTDESYIDKKTGKVIYKTVKSTKMAETDDAFTLSSGTQIEAAYATHANKLKALANESRKASLGIEYTAYSPSARKTYAAEVASLTSSLNLALLNKPLERQAQLMANATIARQRADNPDMDAKDLKKLKGQALAGARARMHAKKYDIQISDREWEAIQAGAITTNTLSQILSNTNLDRIKQLATPRTVNVMTDTKVARAKALLASGQTQSQIATILGVSTSSINNLLDDD